MQAFPRLHECSLSHLLGSAYVRDETQAHGINTRNVVTVQRFKRRNVSRLGATDEFGFIVEKHGKRGIHPGFNRVDGMHP